MDPRWHRTPDGGLQNGPYPKKKENNRMKPKKFVRKRFEVEAVQVTVENFAEVVRWCGGIDVRDSFAAPDDKSYIKVPVRRPMNARQTKAFVGDWVLHSENTQGFKVFTEKAFAANFETEVVAELVFEGPYDYHNRGLCGGVISECVFCLRAAWLNPLKNDGVTPATGEVEQTDPMQFPDNVNRSNI